MMASLSGAAEPPSPVISEVMPWKIFEGRRGSTRMVISDCPSMSMKPGATTLPAASIVRRRVASERLPMATILPSRIPTSPEYQGEPVPSMMCPLVMTMSKVCETADEQRHKSSGKSIQRNRAAPMLIFDMILSNCDFRRKLPSAFSAMQGNSEHNPYDESEPFITCEMSWNRRNNFHQDHQKGYGGARQRHETLYWGGLDPPIGSAGSKPTYGRGDRTDFRDRNQNRIAQEHAECAGDADAHDGDGRCSVLRVNLGKLGINHA